MRDFTKQNYTWLLERGITPKVLSTYKINWEGNRITIPVHNVSGEFLFNKYRVSPWSTIQKPKYTYDRGSNASLYGIHLLNQPGLRQEIIICEGELDVLLLVSKGYRAVSTTGGSGTFLDEWARFFDGKNVYICYDNDDAGTKGSFLVQQKIPHAKIISLPKEVFEGKDVTDFFKIDNAESRFQKLIWQAVSLPMPKPTPVFKTQKAYNDLIKEYRHIIDDNLMMRARYLREHAVSDEREVLLINIFMDEIDKLKAKKASLSRKKIIKSNNKNEIAEAKLIPITDFIQFNNQRFANCIWHDDKNPSMHYYPKTNRVKCFSCGEHGDVLDVVQKLHNINLPQAISFILNNDYAETKTY